MAIDAAAGQTGLLQSHDADAIEAVLAEQARCRLHDPLAFLRLTDKLRSYFRGQVTSKVQEVTAHESANIFGHRSDRGTLAGQPLSRCWPAGTMSEPWPIDRRTGRSGSRGWVPKSCSVIFSTWMTSELRFVASQWLTFATPSVPA